VSGFFNWLRSRLYLTIILSSYDLRWKENIALAKKRTPESRLQIFIGSSVERLSLAYAVQANFEHFSCDATPWDKGLFMPSQYTLQTLVRIVNGSDAAVFIFAPDDLTIIRSEGKKKHR
jgi:predicted nucleotide-binding protein